MQFKTEFAHNSIQWICMLICNSVPIRRVHNNSIFAMMYAIPIKRQTLMERLSGPIKENLRCGIL